MTPELRFKDESYAIVGAAMEVHNELGSGFVESVYAEALAEEFKLRKIPFHREFPLEIAYKGKALGKTFRVDFLVYDQIIVELKALGCVGSVEQAQVMNYLKASALSWAYSQFR